MKLASNAVRVRCKEGCGDFGLQELEYVCVDCDTRKHLHKIDDAPIPQPMPEAKAPRRSGKDAWKALLSVEREKDKAVVDGQVHAFEETLTLARETQTKMKHYMLATNNDEQVDKAVWTQGQPKL
ncbi:Aste57867_23377 [Aphanomyces stellatus]|uniref:Aste57867_23377 protein n=1 Tax=Aphanomyces stellatus TaxID=120398 RepID=A0A485LMQ0_9STRA|nr:hypothetical protein As57867_023306 [Aphanomyces stellatus]VFU00023.1 Aste57867_23377 [Aphanomyces stellatus]